MGVKWKLTQRDLKRMHLINVHPETQDCHDRGCVVHHWSHHHMRNLPLHWRYDRGIFERICSHGVGHPDPDSAAFLERIGKGYENVHGCCFERCCVVPSDK